MSVKLSKIKKVCLRDKQVRIYTANAPQNMVMQWLGVDQALYPVEGVRLTMDMLAVIWELGARQREELDVQEMTILDAVENGLLDDDAAVVLQESAGMVDMEAMESIRMARVFDCTALKIGDRKMTLVQDSYCAPCWYGATKYEVLPRTGMVLVYTDGQLSGVVRMVDQKSAAVAQSTLRVLADRDIEGGRA